MSESTFKGGSIKQKNQRKTKKKNYVSPKLVEYGALAELTGAGAVVGTDGHAALKQIS
ncbi:MAG: lasso RiPP family leader peptide-containing protein [Candidatus Binatia bacterium]